MPNLSKQIILGFVLAGTLAATAAEARSPLRFKVQRRGAPPTVGAATRGGTCIENQQRFQVLMPINASGLTTAANPMLTTAPHPALLVYVPPSSATAIELELETQDSNLVYQETFAVPKEAGVMRLELKNAKLPAMALNRPHRWYATLICNEDDRSNDVTISGWLQRVSPSTTLSRRLGQVSAQEHPRLYAEAGIWQDTVLSLDILRRKDPTNSQFQADWESLLKSVKVDQLDRISKVPLVQ